MTNPDVVIFRNIELNDEASLLTLRNSPSNLEFFKNPRTVSSEDHARWFVSRLTDFRALQIVAVLSNQLIGIVFLVPLDDNSGSISINIDSKYQSQGIGQELLTRMMFRADSLRFSRIEALIHLSNTRSISLFERCGFVFEEKVSGFLVRYVRFTNQNTLR
ncbi:acetyltransferase [Candidatus Planktophila dulcis]|uniref:GNAT family N-acetyltransferase n=1 Tax=Candidatus Planktophila dulcis TaxID=1884914 RepID=UPI000BACD45E|nr:acetyltransferase [Candidatus Planktophila dulcis]